MVRGIVGVLALGAAAALVTSNASGADLRVPQPEQVLAPEMVDWTGPYVGGHVGYGWGHVVVEDAYDWDSAQIR